MRLINFNVFRSSVRRLHKPCLEWTPNISMFSVEDFFKLEKHWQEKNVSCKKQKPHLNQKKYVLSMFPYPSGNLHMGHVRVYTISDCLSRYYSLRGYDVLHPMGWDAFGLPAENAAIERKENPADWTKRNIEIMRDQLLKLGCKFDWSTELATCHPDYYRWTQWIFLQMYKSGLVFQRKSFVNWDPVDCTVLASEQIDANGRSWRSGAVVEQKLLKQWFIKTTKFAKALYDGLDELSSWRGGVVDIQRDWLGDCSLYKFSLPLITCFDRFRDSNGKESGDFVDLCLRNPSDLGRAEFLSLVDSHTLWKMHEHQKLSNGLTTLKAFVFNPIRKISMQILLGSKSEFEPFQKSRLGIPSKNESDLKTFTSLNLSSKSETPIIQVDDAQVIQKASTEGWGGYSSSYKLDDWVVSRQRYWGTPIPMVHCPKCGVVPVPESDLPVLLPKVDRLTVGQSSLGSMDNWCKVSCPQCSSDARRESETLDTFFDSSWYFLRYLDPCNEKLPCAPEKSARMMPVDVYVGGKEHACLHLYYARFFMHFMKSIGLTTTAEPFKLLLPQGMVMGKAYRMAATGRYLPHDMVETKENGLFEKGTDSKVEEIWEKMSKSRYNGVNPADILGKYGSDMTRLIMLDNVSPLEHRNWKTDGYKGLHHWLNRMRYMVSTYVAEKQAVSSNLNLDLDPDLEKELKYFYNRSVQKVTFYFERTFVFNSALAELIKLTNFLRKQPANVYRSSKGFEKCLHSLIIMISPLAPNASAEMWSVLCQVDSQAKDLWAKDDDIWDQRWPTLDEDAKLKLDFSIDGKALGSVIIDQRLLPSVTLDQALEYASTNENLQKHLNKHCLRIIGGRLEVEEFYGVRTHLEVEETGEEKIEIPKKKRKKEKKEKMPNI